MRNLSSEAKLHDFKTFSRFYCQLLWYLRPVGKWHSPLLTYVPVYHIYKLFGRSIRREDSSVLCYLAYLPMVAFNGVGGVYQLTYRRCIPEVFREAFPVVTPWFYDDGIRSPHLLSSVSNCVSTVSLLTAPYTVLRLRRNSFWCLLPTYLIELRIWWTIQRVGHLYRGIRSV